MAKRKTGRKGTIRWRRWLAAAVALPVVVSAALTLPLRWLDPATTAFMLQDDSGRIPVAHDWRDWDEIGVAAPLAVLAAEDQRFAEHHGFDVKSIRQSLADAGNGGALRGASTISQQLAKNLYLWSGRSFLRKGLEAWLTLNLELFLPKRRILEIYLNVAEFGPGIYGVAAASGDYFGKEPGRLTDREAALLAAVLPNPARLNVDRPSAYVRDRQSWIFGQMQRLRREGFLARIE